MLKDIKSPKDIKNLSYSELDSLAAEIRQVLVESVSKTGGHLASNLGVVELTLALHSVFDFEKDRLIWDVGHQSYVHKILTGRLDKINTIRQFGGISGFPKTSESIYDAFNTGHASTSASAAMGMARARDLSKKDYEVVSVFGDGALTGGMMFEALNDAGHSNSKVIFILNDNNMSISQNVGAVSRYLQRIRTKPNYIKSKDLIEKILSKLPVGSGKATKTAKKAKDAIKRTIIPSTLFDNLGLNYIGPVDGHNIKALKTVFEYAKKSDKPCFIHVITKKGKGYHPAEDDPQQYHGISPKKKSSPDYSDIFGKTLTELSKNNEKIVAITAAMPDNTGLTEFSKTFEDRYFDVGIAEEHAVTMAAGFAISGYVPVVPIYSSFFQRAYDQILHDVCLQNLHAVLCFDHAGIVGEDGETHHGLFDIAMLSSLPNMSLLSPSSFKEFSQMLNYAVNVHNGPIAIRYPKGSLEARFTPFEFGKAHILEEGSNILIISTGRMIKTAEAVAKHFSAQLVSLPTIMPIDTQTVFNSAKNKQLIVTIEDAVEIGGIGSLISKLFLENGIFIPIDIISFPQEPIVHGSIAELDRYYSIDTASIITRIEDKLNDIKTTT